MIADVRHLLGRRPFVPFTIVTSSGQKYDVPTVDHIGINPQGTRVIVWFDDDGHVPISPLHITALEIKGAETPG